MENNESFLYRFDQLSPELIENIYGYLDSISLLSCSQVCRNWRRVFIRVTGHVGYTPKIIRAIMEHLDHNTMLAARSTCHLWKQGLDILTSKNVVRLNGQSHISFIQTNHISSWRRDNFADPMVFSNHNPFPSRVIQLVLDLDGIQSLSKMEAMTTSLSYYGSHVRVLNLKIEVPSTLRVWNNMWKIVLTVLNTLSYMRNLVGLSFHISSVIGNLPRRHCISRKTLKGVQLNLENLRIFRLVSWDFSNSEMEWLYYKILRHSPNLEFFDPDFLLGYRKFKKICHEPAYFPLRLKCLKIAVSGSVIEQFCRHLREKKIPLNTLFLDIFDYRPVKHCSYVDVIKIVVSSTGGYLENLSISFSHDSRFVPLTGNSGRSSSTSSDTFNEIRSNTSHFSLKHLFFCKRLRLLLLKRKLEPASVNLKNLKLRGLNGPLTFLKNFKQLERLILLDYDPLDQSIFQTIRGFHHFLEILPSLKELHTSYYGVINEKNVTLKMINEEYVPVYW